MFGIATRANAGERQECSAAVHKSRLLVKRQGAGGVGLLVAMSAWFAPVGESGLRSDGGHGVGAYAIAQSGAVLRIQQLERSETGKLVTRASAELDLAPRGAADHRVRYAEVSPGGDWLALGTNLKEERLLAIMRCSDLEVIEAVVDRPGESWRWFWWESGPVLREYRALGLQGGDRRRVHIYEMRPPDWLRARRRVTQEPVEISELRLGYNAEVSRLRDEAAAVMFRLRYPGPNVSGGGGAGGAIVGGWRRHFNGNLAEVRRDGRTICAVTFDDRRNANCLVLLRRSEGGWKEINRTAVPNVWHMSFWSGWAVAGLSDLVWEQPEAPARSRYVERRRRLVFISLETGRQQGSVSADVFAPPGEKAL